ncbi:transcription factor that binds to CRE motif [Diatrype stigma]|uniref:Transcription factor that binds to CRE motif n=1 Tax=Diatrype stigma TaxID=117547 RepID=A0AAN9ULR8_9PEZI
MASEESQVAMSSTPTVKFEASPAESFLSTPEDMYPSLFDTSSTMDPIESVMSPPGSEDAGDTPSASSSPAPESSDKKAVKKRKSWGQVLPEPKTNLPPRKRAKTEDEKEQRRVERVLRNRRAAQSSRERKRQEVEALEQRCKELEAALQNRDKTVELLVEEMKKLRKNPGGSSRGSSPFDSLEPSPLTLSQALFSSSNDSAVPSTSGKMDDFLHMPEHNATVNPASLSPELNAVADTTEDNKDSAATPTTNAAPSTADTSADLTQHPAAVLCDQQSPNAVDRLLGDAFGVPASLDLDRWGLENQLSPSADPLNFEYDHMAGDATPQFQDFDFEQFLSTDDSGAAPGASAGSDSIAQEPEFTSSLFDSETQIPSEAFNQQPHTGASLDGCDDGVLAVGV